MNFQPCHFTIRIKLNKTKSIIYGDLEIPIDYNILKSCSDYFNENDKIYSTIDKIHILTEEKELYEFPSFAIIDFVNCCQNQEIEINQKNILYLNYLSKKYSVKDLEEITQKKLSENKGNLALQSLLFNIQVSNDKTTPLVSTNEEESIITQNFEEYIKNEQLIQLPIPILYRIVEKYYSNKPPKDENDQNNKNGILNDFLFRLLDKRGREASIFFSFFDVEKNRINDLVKLRDSYSDIFDDNFLNNSLMNTTIELFQELTEIKRISNEQKSQIQLMTEKESNLSNIINQMKCEMKQIKKNMNVHDDDIKYLIQTGKEWNGNDNFFTIEDNSCTVISSTHETGGYYYYAKFLFDGKKETNFNVWASSFKDPNASIQINFPNPVIIDVIKITSRNRYFDQTPTHFEIFGINDQNQEESLEEFKVKWENDQTKLFPFFNNKSYSMYKFKFYEFNLYAGIAELNLGQIDLIKACA